MTFGRMSAVRCIVASPGMDYKCMSGELPVAARDSIYKRFRVLKCDWFEPDQNEITLHLVVG